MGTLRFFEEVVSFKIRRTFGFADYIFSASSLPGPAVNPAGRKTIGLRYRTTGGEKEKFKSL